MHREIISLLDRKLQEALRKVDDEVESSIRQCWEYIGPGPECPFVSSVMGCVEVACAEGLRKREEVAHEILLATLPTYGQKLTTKLGASVMSLVVSAFPLDKFVLLVEQTSDVFDRSGSEARKFQDGTYQIEVAKLKAATANGSRRAVERLRVVVDDLVLQTRIRRVPWWRPALKVLYGVACGTIKWILGIFAAVVVVYLTWYFNLPD